ncbi:MAG: penicillin-binding protein [Frankiales bacterium]|nr:penicillin-binding protein [Frankiales bacterium]
MGRLSNVRWKRVVLLVGAGSVLSLTALVGVGYALTDVPAPNANATASLTRILYADRSELGRVGTENRIPVRLGQVPEHVQLAVLAAEDRGFYSEPGISPKGIARALFTNVRGGGVQQGGSTITQQYAKNAFLTSDRTYTRKVKEVFIALKMTRTVKKSQILENYLNTIFFGRQASGIQVATKAYFGGDVSDLSISQGAVLAASIRSPARLDPAKHPAQAKARWAYVLDGMVEKGWLSPADRAKQVYPFVLPPGAGPRNNDLSGPDGHVITAVLDELANNGFPEDRLSAGGLTVQTTIRKGAQEAAIKAVQAITTDKPGAADLQGALVSVKPGTGEIWAYYGGATGTGFDFANQGLGRQPGSTFKPYVLATALSQGKSLRTRLDGNTRKSFPGLARPIDNFGNESFGRVNLTEATQKSINTAYYELGLEVGPAKVAELAHAAGIPDSVTLKSPDGTTNGGISLGGYEVHVLDQAVGYATFANKGVPAKSFMVKNVKKGDETLYNAEITLGEPAFSPDVAADATYAMQQVVERGTGRGARLDGGREAAGKTGTSTANTDAWFVGFTPQLSTAVWLGYAQPKTIVIDGVEATGGGFSTRIWKAYMDPALQGQDDLSFPPRANVGASTSGTDFTPQPRRSRQPSFEPSPPAEPSVAPEPSPLPAPSRAPSPDPSPPPPVDPIPAPAASPSPGA